MSISMYRSFLSRIAELMGRVEALERFNHADVLTFGNIKLDAATGKIHVGANDEIIIDGSTKRINVGTSSEIVIDGASKEITVGTGTFKTTIDGNTGQIKIGDNRFILDSANRRLIVTDGTNNRVVLGDV